jgi:hypothetical protein
LNHTNVIRATALAAMALVSAAAFAAPSIDANIELDSKYQNNGRGASQSGRVELNAGQKLGANYFMAGRATYLSHPDGTTGTDDLWAQFGTSSADIKLGRFEATNLFQTPGDVIVEYAGFSPYQANLLRGRQNATSNGSAPFHAAATVQLGGGMSFELSGVSTKGSGFATGVRPVLSYANGPLHLAAGVEALKFNGTPLTTTPSTTCTLNPSTNQCTFATITTSATPSVSRTGYGVTGDYNFGPVTLTANYAQVKNLANIKANTFGLMASAGNLTLASVFGKGSAANADDKVTTFWAAYAIPFFDVKGAKITPAISHSKAGGSNTAANATGFALRVNYEF